MAGIVSALNKRNENNAKDTLHHTGCNAVGVGVLKGEGYLEGLVEQFLPASLGRSNWHIEHNYHFGGYAKAPNELRTFCNDFQYAFDLISSLFIPAKPFGQLKICWPKVCLKTGHALLYCTQAACKAQDKTPFITECCAHYLSVLQLSL